MRVIVIGLGVQGVKRKRIAAAACVGTVDPVADGADFRSLTDVPGEAYDAALVCTPDEPKPALLTQLLEQGKHILVEKPLWAPAEEDLARLERLARERGVMLYTAYNHRFEPHFRRMRDLVDSGALGRLYRCRMAYGNGTARLVRESAWRDAGSGVLHDLGSHLLDTARWWFGELGGEPRLIACHRFENRAPDHAVVGLEGPRLSLELEMSLLSWRNDFVCDLYGENGSAHIQSLCKWGPSTFIHRRRVLPSGRPPEDTETLVQDDPTWEAEWLHFQGLVASGAKTDLAGDRWLLSVLGRLAADAEARR